MGAPGCLQRGRQDHADYNRIYRNSFYHNGHQETDPGFQGGIYFANWSGQSPVGNIVKGNIFYDNKNGAVTYEGQVDPQVVENNWDQNSVDPKFVNLSASDPDNPDLPDLHLQAGSPCIDAGAYPTGSPVPPVPARSSRWRMPGTLSMAGESPTCRGTRFNSPMDSGRASRTSTMQPT